MSDNTILSQAPVLPVSHDGKYGQCDRRLKYGPCRQAFHRQCHSGGWRFFNPSGT
ncbi:hypothetical protein OH492_16885 [Vibrio chagasii]|nr:hypothetical protein [Vibrio chagasii]